MTYKTNDETPRNHLLYGKKTSQFCNISKRWGRYAVHRAMGIERKGENHADVYFGILACHVVRIINISY